MDKYIYALGTFDGVHLGHQALLAAAAQMAAQTGAMPGAYTFTHLPRETVANCRIGMLTTAEQRYALLEAAGAEKVVAEDFCKVKELSPEQFIYYLCGVHGAEGFVCGKDFRFGKNGAGDADALRRICRRLGKEVQVLDFLQDARGEKLSSRHIRTYVSDGNMEAARAAMGRPFFVEGKVQQGKGLARQWGTPTLNIALPEELVLPRFGVYATDVTVEGKVYRGVTNVGIRPTFDDGDKPNTETYVLDGDFDAVSQAKVEFLQFIRSEKNFADEKSLQLQIAKDIQTVKEL